MAVNGSDRLPDEFDEVTSQIKYPEINGETTEKEFVNKAGNGYKKWAALGLVGVMAGLALFMWAMLELL